MNGAAVLRAALPGRGAASIRQGVAFAAAGSWARHFGGTSLPPGDLSADLLLGSSSAAQLHTAISSAAREEASSRFAVSTSGGSVVSTRRCHCRTALCWALGPTQAKLGLKPCPLHENLAVLAKRGAWRVLACLGVCVLACLGAALMTCCAAGQLTALSWLSLGCSQCCTARACAGSIRAAPLGAPCAQGRRSSRGVLDSQRRIWLLG